MSNQFSDKLKKTNRMHAYSQNSELADEIVVTVDEPIEVKIEEKTPDEKPQKQRKEKKQQKVSSKSDLEANEGSVGLKNSRLISLGQKNHRKVGASITLSEDVKKALDNVVEDLINSGYTATISSSIDEILREWMTDMGYLKKRK